MRLIDRRIGLLFAAFLALCVLTMLRAAWLQGVRGSELSADARGQQTAAIPVPGHRGRVLDRKGKELAVSEDASTVFATPYQLKDPVRAMRKLAPVLGVSSNELLERVAHRRSGFAYLRRKLSAARAERVRRMDIEGIGVIPDTRRVYPQGPLASQVIGTVGVENRGLTGLEQDRNRLLRGADGERKVVKDARGDTISLDTVEGAETGRDLGLTIDADLQARTERVLGDLARAYQPRGATAVVMDPRSGEVLAMANWPRVDPNDPGGVKPQALLNRATGFTYEPGSTYKAFTVAAALEEGKVTPETSFALGPTIQVADRTIEEAHEGGGGTLTVSQILAQSSNVGAVTIGLKVGKDDLDKWIRRFGFGRRTGIDYPGEEQGIVPEVRDYSGSTMGNLPIGQGLSVTPMQMIAGYAAIANGGILPEPHLIREVDGRPVRGSRGRRVLKPQTSAKLRKMLKGVLAPGGTAEEVSVPGYELAGKTGTAQKVVGGTYSESDYVASFVGFAPADNPQLLAAIVVDEPKGTHYGGVVAAPAFGEIASFALPYLGISPR